MEFPPLLIRLTYSAPQCWRVGMPPHPVQPPSSAVPSGDLAGKFPNGFVPCLKPLALLSTARARFRTGTPGWAHASSSDHYWRRPLHHPNQFQQPNGTWRRFIATNAIEETLVFKSHVRLYLARCLLSFHFVSILVFFQIHHPREYIQSVYLSYIQNRTNWIFDYNIDPNSVRPSKIW